MFRQKLRILWIIPLLIGFFLLGSQTSVFAAQFITEDYTLEESEIIEDNVYICGENIKIAGVIDGDLFIASEIINISGTITGDLYAIGNDLDLSGNIYGSVFLAGQNVEISGSIARNSFILSMFSDISGNIGKDLTVFTGNSSITGKIIEDIRVMANRSIVSGIINGEALIYSNSSTIDQDLVEGEVYENQGLEESEGLNSIIQSSESNLKNSFLTINVFTTLISFVSMYIVGTILIYLAPVKTLQIEKKVIGSLEEFILSFITGLGVCVVLPLPLIILLFTLIGAPLALLIASFLLFVTIFGTVWVESAIGQKILSTTKRKDPKRLLSLLVGRGLTTVVNFIPIVRCIYNSILSITAVGAITRVKYSAYRKGKSKK